MEDDISKIPSIYRITTDIEALLCCIEKEFELNANYHKGHGPLFEKWMLTYHPVIYLYPITHACGGARQDLGVEGAPAVLITFLTA